MNRQELQSMRLLYGSGQYQKHSATGYGNKDEIKEIVKNGNKE